MNNIHDQYSETHKDALSDGDPQGKGTGTIKTALFLEYRLKTTCTIFADQFATLYL